MIRSFSRIALLLIVVFTVAACGGKKVYMTPMEAQKDMVAIAQSEITEITPAQLKEWQDSGKEFAFYDVRTRKEFAGGYIEGATNIPRGLIEFLIPKVEQDNAKTLVIMCKSGGRGALATKTLQDMSYKEVYNLQGGFMAWEKAGLPVAKK